MYKDILQVIPAMQSTTLAVDNLNFMHKKNKDASDFMKQGTKNIIGTQMIKETANFI